MPVNTRKLAAQRAREYWAVQPLFLDTETTGVHPTAEIIEISVIDHLGEVLLDTLVKPTRKIPLDAMRIHHITDEMAAEAPAWPDVWPLVEAVVRGCYVGVYNADFDLRMIRQSFQAHGQAGKEPALRAFCLMKLYADFAGSTRWVTLEEARLRSGISLPNAHRARADALVARELLKSMATRTW
jgi:DNA polymerase-3 subunit epsilon